MLCVNEVCHTVSRCVKYGSCFRQAWSKSQWTVLMYAGRGLPAPVITHWIVYMIQPIVRFDNRVERTATVRSTGC